MRTTVIIEDVLWEKVQAHAGPRQTSEFINGCLVEHFQRLERARRMVQLEKAYGRVAKTAGRDDHDVASIEDWPAW